MPSSRPSTTTAVVSAKKLAGGNLLRVLAAAEATAPRLAAQRPPSTASIEELDAKKAR